MQRLAPIALVLASLLSACASTTSFGASADGHPPQLQYGVDVPMWDHYCASVTNGTNRNEILRQLLDEASERGWELVAAQHGFFCFKRPRARTPLQNAPGATEP